MPRHFAALAGLIVALGCSRPVRQEELSPSRPDVPRASARLPAKPVPAIDPASDKAAEELAGSFARLLNQRKFEEAYRLLGAGAPSRAEFDQWFAPFSNLEVRTGAAGDEEGAAGSIYLSVPLTMRGRSGARQVERSAILIFRRVNEVPGSTRAQRQWHIERIDWKSAPARRDSSPPGSTALRWP